MPTPRRHVSQTVAFSKRGDKIEAHARPEDLAQLRGRAPELALLAAASEAVAAGGSGRLVLLEGEPGIGRSALLQRAAADATAHGLEVLRARGGDLERDLTFGVARQLLESRVRRAGEEERAGLLAGAAVHAGGLLGAPGAAASALDEPSLVHGLFWVCANLAETTPLCLAVDDAQWSDPASLRWLVYMARRLEELPILLLVSVASGEPDAPQQLLLALATQQRSTRIALTPLDPADTAAIVREELPDAPDELCGALHEAAGGNPFLVREAAANLAADGNAGDEQSVRVRLGPEAAAGFVLRRLERLPPEDSALARAVAVLGSDAALAQAAALAELGPEVAATAADRLVMARILSPQRPLAFVHPVVGSTLYAAIGAGRRSTAHARAARMLHAAGVADARVVTHLLAAEPAGEPEVVRLLRAAAEGEPDPRRAVLALRRALQEPPPPEERGPLLLELGRAEMRAYDPEAVPHLEESRSLARDRGEWLEATHALARAWTLDPSPAAALEWVRTELAGLADAGDEPSREARLALSALQVIRGNVSPEEARALRAECEPAATASERYLLAALAYKGLSHGTAEEATTMATRALEGGLRAEGIRATGAILAIAALEVADALEAADEAARHALALAREAGDVSGAAIALTVAGDIACRRGALAAAESDARDALALADELGLAWAEPVTIATLLESLSEQGRAEEAERLLAERELSDWQRGSARASTYLQGRGRLRLEQGRYEDAVRDYQAAGDILRDYAIDHSAMSLWRTYAAEAMLALGRTDEAAELVAVDLENARAFGVQHPQGAALRVSGLISGDLDRLREAVAVLEESPAALERARALVDLGAALRRGGERAASREPLRQGMDLAHRCGASTLADRAQQELAASGARPRRRALTGVEALTPGEARIAQMAAGGRSNREIAQTLFLSVRTVENQLRRVYSKLEIGSRRELADALTER
jgi:DNA-binding CsgD family transcriptional regulator